MFYSTQHELAEQVLLLVFLRIYKQLKDSCTWFKANSFMRTGIQNLSTRVTGSYAISYSYHFLITVKNPAFMKLKKNFIYHFLKIIFCCQSPPSKQNCIIQLRVFIPPYNKVTYGIAPCSSTTSAKFHSL